DDGSGGTGAAGYGARAALAARLRCRRPGTACLRRHARCRRCAQRLGMGLRRARPGRRGRQRVRRPAAAGSRPGRARGAQALLEILMDDVPPLAIRAAAAADMAQVAAIYAHHVRHGLASFEETPPDAAEMARRHAEIVARSLPYLVAIAGECVVGYAYAG